MAVLEVRDRKSLWQGLHRASVESLEVVQACLCSYSPPSKRLILSSLEDFAALGISSPQQLHDVADESFWAYKDFYAVVSSFQLPETDPERRVMGIEGIGSKAALHAAIQSGERVLRIGHLSLGNLRGKVANQEWRWIDKHAMDTSTLKPALLRPRVRELLGVELRVMRHDAHLADGGPTESLGDLVIFDIDHANPTGTEVGNSKVFCQCPSNYDVGEFAALSADQRNAVQLMLEIEFTRAP